MENMLNDNLIISANPFLRKEESHYESGSSTALPSHSATFIWEEYVIGLRLVSILTGTNKSSMQKYLRNQISLCEQDIEQATRLEKEYDNIIYCKSKHEEFWKTVVSICFLDPLRVNQLKTIKRNNYLLASMNPSKTTNGVTQDQILHAKKYPITDLVTFKSGQALCPFHSEKTPSFNYNKKNNTARCFGACQKTYDSIALYQALNNCSFIEAVRKLQ